jgi:hypothetical protein
MLFDHALGAAFCFWATGAVATWMIVLSALTGRDRLLWVAGVIFLASPVVVSVGWLIMTWACLDE